MDVVGLGPRKVIVYDGIDPQEVHPAAYQICRDKHPRLADPETLNGRSSCGLALVGAQVVAVNALKPELLVQLLCALLCRDKD
jgi:hypothetical protein